jgi:hypothetical protein
MNACYPVRRLSQVGEGVVDSTHYARGAAGLFQSASDRAGAVYDVHAAELTLTHDEIMQQLQRGELRSTDLVQVDGAWSTLLDSAPFGEEAEKRAGGEALGRNLKYIAMGAGSFVLLLLYVFLRMSAH